MNNDALLAADFPFFRLPPKDGWMRILRGRIFTQNYAFLHSPLCGPNRTRLLCQLSTSHVCSRVTKWTSNRYRIITRIDPLFELTAIEFSAMRLRFSLFIRALCRFENNRHFDNVRYLFIWRIAIIISQAVA